MNALAAAGALASIVGHRRQAVWAVTGVEPRPPVLEDAPILDITPSLSPPSEGQDLVADYASLGLTLGRHPVALLRPRLDRLRMVTATQLKQLPHGKLTRAAGIVIGRQRPDTASGVIFVTLEDETGMINVVVWRDVAEKQRRALLGSQLLAVHGVLERQGDVVHLIAGKLADHSAPPRPTRGPLSGLSLKLHSTAETQSAQRRHKAQIDHRLTESTEDEPRSRS